MRMRLPRSMRAAALLFAAAAAAAAGSPPAAEKPAEVCPAIDPPTAPAHAARLHVFVDPATGRVREPTADELRAYAERRRAARAAAPAPVFEVVTYPDGMVAVDLGDAFLFDVRLSRQPDGSRRLECVPRSAVPAPAPER
jgi:hypothetical protein